MSCACRREGASCSPLCGCAHDARSRGTHSQNCYSPFSRLPQIFEETPGSVTLYRGLTTSWCVTRANPCFKKYLNLEPNKRRQLDVEGLKSKVMADCDAWRDDRWLKGWRVILQDDTADEEEKKQIWNSLMEYAVGKHNNVGRMRVMMDDPSSHVWSSCRDRWVLRSSCKHCEGCDICYDDAWHCKECNTCKVGRWFACDGCQGFSFTGAKYGVVKGRLTQDARTVQGGLSLGRPKKRAREVEYHGYHLTSEVSKPQRLLMLDAADNRSILDISRGPE
jgi:hypothetical protein